MLNKVLAFILLLSTISLAQLVQPRIAVQQIEHNYGTVKQGEKVVHDFILSNSGGDELIIKGVRASCGCTAATPEKDKLAPGESTKLHVVFNTKGRLGRQNKHIYVSTNDPEKPQLILSLEGTVLKELDEAGNYPRLHLPETHHDFGKVSEGEVVNYTFKFVNSGEGLLKINNIKTSCGCTAALISEREIQPGGTGTIRVELDTKNRYGRMSRTVTVNSNDPEEPNKIITIYADVQKGT